MRGAEVLWIGGDADQRLGGELEQQPVDHCLVRVREVGNRRRQREHDVVVLDRQQVGTALLEPAPCGAALALRAVAVAAGVVGDRIGAAAGTVQHMPAQRRAAAGLDGRHDLELGQTQVAALLVSPRRPGAAEDVRDFQGRGAWRPVMACARSRSG